MSDERIPTMPFGKHKGEPVADVPHDYLEWLLKNKDFRDGDWLLLAIQGVLRAALPPDEIQSPPADPKDQQDYGQIPF